MPDVVAVTARHFDVDPSAYQLLVDHGFEVVASGYGSDRPDSNISADALVELLRDASGVIIGLAPLTASVLSRCEKLKAISVRGVGTDCIDVQHAAARGIAIAITPGTIDGAVAECAIALIMCLSRNVVQHHASVQRGEWRPVLGAEVRGKVLGVIGLGRIGSEVARLARALGMHVVAHTRRDAVARADAVGATAVTLEELLATSDYVSLHCALTDETEGLIGHRELQLMKPDACLVNTARGALVDELALHDALASERLRGAGVDVFREEPPDPSSPLLSAPRTVLMPHAAGYTFEGLRRSNRAAAENLVRLLTTGGEPPTRESMAG